LSGNLKERDRANLPLRPAPRFRRDLDHDKVDHWRPRFSAAASRPPRPMRLSRRARACSAQGRSDYGLGRSTGFIARFRDTGG